MVEELAFLQKVLLCLRVIFWVNNQFIQKYAHRNVCSEEILQPWINGLQCRVEAHWFWYLGFPVGATPRLKATWDTIVEKFESRLSMWKRQYVCLGGRVNSNQNSVV